MERKPTLEELLAGIFLEKCLVAHGTVKVVNHQSKNGGDILLRVTCIVSESGILKRQLVNTLPMSSLTNTYPGSLVQDKTRKVHG